MQISATFVSDTNCIYEALVLRASCVPDKMGLIKRASIKNCIAIIMAWVGVCVVGRSQPTDIKTDNKGA